MKHLILLFFLSSIGFIAKAQITRLDTINNDRVDLMRYADFAYTPEFMYTISLRTYALEQFPQILNQPGNDNFYSSGFNGLMFKFNDNQISYRLSGSYFNRDIAFDNTCRTCEFSAGKLQNTLLKVGFEKNLNYSRIQPYFGIDLGYSNQKYSGSIENVADVTSTTSQGTIDRKNSALASPFIGIRLNIIPRLSIAAESNMAIAYSYQKTQRNTVLEANRIQNNEVNNNKWEYFFSPVGMLSLQFHFGSLF